MSRQITDPLETALEDAKAQLKKKKGLFFKKKKKLTEAEYRERVRGLLKEKIETMETAYDHVFEEKKLGFTIALARYAEGRHFVRVEEVLAHGPPALKATDELIAVQDQIILEPTKARFEELKKAIAGAKRPLKLTFIHGQGREAPTTTANESADAPTAATVQAVVENAEEFEQEAVVAFKDVVETKDPVFPAEADHTALEVPTKEAEDVAKNHQAPLEAAAVAKNDDIVTEARAFCDEAKRQLKLVTASNPNRGAMTQHVVLCKEAVRACKMLDIDKAVATLVASTDEDSEDVEKLESAFYGALSDAEDALEAAEFHDLSTEDAVAKADGAKKALEDAERTKDGTFAELARAFADGAAVLALRDDSMESASEAAKNADAAFLAVGFPVETVSVEEVAAEHMAKAKAAREEAETSGNVDAALTAGREADLCASLVFRKEAEEDEFTKFIVTNHAKDAQADADAALKAVQISAEIMFRQDFFYDFFYFFFFGFSDIFFFISFLFKIITYFSASKNPIIEFETTGSDA